MIKNKGFSLINIIGLTIGLTSFLLIALYITDELTFDRFHKQTKHIYRVVETQTTLEGKQTKAGGVGYQIGGKVKTDFPEVKDVARVAVVGRANISAINSSNVFYEDFWIANPGFLTAFDFKLTQGDRNSALTAPHSVILTEETAMRLFGTVNVLGKAIKADRDSIPCQITGILKDFPANSHISFNLCFSEASMADRGFQNYIKTDWASGLFNTYLLLDKKSDAHATASKIKQLVAANQPKNIQYKRSFILQPLKDIRLHSEGIENGVAGAGGNMMYIYVFSIIGCFVLLIACINYMNLTTAHFANRGKEIAVRKVAGALPKSLVGQFLSEAFVVTLFALVLALSLTKLLLPLFNAFTGKQLTLGIQTGYHIWLGVFIIAILVGLLSGIYPALFLSRLKPFLLLKNKISTGKGNLSLRRGLVVFQFSLSIIMIIATMIIYRQINYVKTKDLGFNKDQLVVIDINSGKVRRDAATIKNEFGKLAAVKDVSLSSRVPGEWKNLVRIKVKNEKIQSADGNDMYFLAADDRFLNTYQMQLVKGRNFMKGQADTLSVLINQTAANELGITEPVGQMINIQLAQPFRVQVAGIVKDFNFQSLREAMTPMVIGFQNNPIQMIDYFTAKVEAGNIDETIRQMEAIIHNSDQDHLFEYHFLDKQWELFYREDKIRETIFLMGAILSILIACLGLFGLSIYAAEQRIKEIGIRKVLGASVGGVILMLSKDFLKLVCIAAIIAFPVAWWAMNKWLDDFAYRVNISWWIFFTAAVLAILIALVTTSFQAIKAAISNPVKSLRTE